MNEQTDLYHFGILLAVMWHEGDRHLARQLQKAALEFSCRGTTRQVERSRSRLWLLGESEAYKFFDARR